MRPAPERLAAKAAGERFYTDGKPCKNGHANMPLPRKTTDIPEELAWVPEYLNVKATSFSISDIISWGARRRTSTGQCVECSKRRVRRYLDSHPGEEARWARERRARDPSSHRAEVKRWAEKNPEQTKASVERWKQRHPEEARRRAIVYTERYRARKSENGGCFTTNNIALLYERQKGRCVGPRCGKRLGDDFEIDHVVPVSRGGSSDPSNLQLLCLPCNRRKGGKDPVIYAQELGQLL